MYPLPRLTVLPADGPEAPLCRAGGHTCAACCHGDKVPRAALERRLARQTSLFERLIGPGPPSRWRLLLFELDVRRGADLFWALLLLVPGLGGLVCRWLRPRSVCAFLGLEGTGRVGCLLHPTRWQGLDLRRRAAFALRPGFGCGPADFLCLPAHRFARAPWRARRRFLREAAGLDWFAFGRAAGAFRVAPGEGEGERSAASPLTGPRRPL
jgi:hypothetical protein